MKRMAGITRKEEIQSTVNVFSTVFIVFAVEKIHCYQHLAMGCPDCKHFMPGSSKIDIHLFRDETKYVIYY